MPQSIRPLLDAVEEITGPARLAQQASTVAAVAAAVDNVDTAELISVAVDAATSQREHAIMAEIMRTQRG